MKISLRDYQREAIAKLRPGCILCGGTGSGKSRTSVGYYYTVCGGTMPESDNEDWGPRKKKIPLYIITVAHKRDTHEWDDECRPYGIFVDAGDAVVDSWNNIKKYVNVKDAFFIFDEQRVVGSGAWVDSFLKITKNNKWILVTATPGDTWSDYLPVFLANKFFANKTEFNREHVVFNRFTKYPKIDRYINVGPLQKFRNQILINMKYSKHTNQNHNYIKCNYNKTKYSKVSEKHWNIFEDQPIETPSECFYLMRKVVNSDYSRLTELLNIFKTHKKIILFYNFDYELELLRETLTEAQIPFSELNGHKHEAIIDGDEWIYIVQYSSGAEGWNCTLTDTIVFYSQNYSYKIMVQSAGRIDRLTTKFDELYYYHLISDSPIDASIKRSLASKKNFNERGSSLYKSFEKIENKNNNK